ncbi:MAG TPA: AraC family transcriptional regulator [Hyphomonadaceae bacterium]|nr:AraC family transcriptional regulator [Hyphomonadaceae bacterium]
MLDASHDAIAGVHVTHPVMQALLMAAAGAMLAMAVAMLRTERPVARWTGFIFDIAVAAYAIKLWNDDAQLLGPILSFLLLATAIGTVGWYWLFVMALFEDACRIRRTFVLIVAATIVTGLVGGYTSGAVRTTFWLATNITQVGMALHALAIVWRGWKDDLVEARRRIRGPFLITVTTYILVMRGFDMAETLGYVPAWYPMTNAAALAVICVTGAFMFLESRDEFFGARRPAPRMDPPPIGQAPATAGKPANDYVANENSAQPSMNGHVTTSGNGSALSLDRAARADLDRLENLMCAQQAWREEGLTIASLAVRANMPEAHLRRLINDRLGYRNFPSYVNGHRIAAAKTKLSDPESARISVSTIAYDIGFASLGPFNRAFKEETGVSPTEWRRKALGIDTPIHEET